MAYNIVITGGTGTLGRALIRRYRALASSAKIGSKAVEKVKLFCFSRDELKQKQLKADHPEVTCVLGDIRDKDSYGALPQKIDVLYHVAALKHIDALQENPSEAVRSNLLGTMALADYAINAGVRRFVFSSTDKAVFPINIYGHSKAMAETYLLHLNKRQTATRFEVFRWGNVLGSRGSVIHLFSESLKAEKKVYLTSPEMTRFWINIDKAAAFMAAERKDVSKVLIPPMKAAKVSDLATVVAAYMNIEDYETKIIGLRPGEKIHEDITEGLNSRDAEQYTTEELIEMVASVL